MSIAKHANVPAIYPLKGEHKKPEHAEPQVIEGKTGNEQNVPEPTDNVGREIELPDVNEPQEVHEQPSSLQPRTEFYQSNGKRPNPSLEPSSYLQVMSKQLPKYEGMLKPEPIKIELRGR